MRYLIVDDEQYRHAVYGTRYAGNEIVSVYTYGEAVDALVNQPRFDVVHLDHDLGFRSTLQHPGGLLREATGYDVAKFIALDLLTSKRPGKVIVHSLNASRTKPMAGILIHEGVPATIEPFTVEWLINPRSMGP